MFPCNAALSGTKRAHLRHGLQLHRRDTGPWIFGKKVLLPAGVISRIDRDDEKVYVNRTKDQIEGAPEFDQASYREDDYRNRVGSYYGPGGTGYAPW
jgi:hypothetical protein